MKGYRHIVELIRDQYFDHMFKELKLHLINTTKKFV
jgi:hypothetical protein